MTKKYEISKCPRCGFQWKTGTNGNHSCVNNLKMAIKEAVDLAVAYGGIDGSHHKDWVIDQMVRVLSGDEYDDVVRNACNGEDGPNTYEWDIGIAP